MADMTFCRGCGKEIHRTAAACPHCGAAQRTRSYKSKTVAAVLAFLLGGLGVHRFYLRQWWGIFYLLLCWTYIPAVVALVECLVFAFSDQEKWDDKYNEGIPGSGGSGAAVVIAIVAVFVGVAVVGILAAIAIPAYQDYTVRASVSGALQATDPIRQEVAAAIGRNAGVDGPRFDAMASQAVGSTPYLDYVRVAPNGGVTLGLKGSASLQGKTMVFEPQVSGGSVVWLCGSGSLEPKYRPAACRR